MRSRALLLLLYLSECWGKEYLYQDIEAEEADDDYYTDFYYSYAGGMTEAEQTTRTRERFEWIRSKFTLKRPEDRYWPANVSWALESEPNEEQWQSMSAAFDKYFSRVMYDAGREGGIRKGTMAFPDLILTGPGYIQLDTPDNIDRSTSGSSSRRRPKGKGRRTTTKTTTETTESTTTKPQTTDYGPIESSSSTAESATTTESTGTSTEVLSTTESTTETVKSTMSTSTTPKVTDKDGDETVSSDSGSDGDDSGTKPTGPVHGTWYPPWVYTYWSDGVPHTYPKQIFINGSWHDLPEDWPFHTTHTCPKFTPKTTTTTTTTRPPTLRLDIGGLLSLIANLTYFYDMNLTDRFNETLVKYGVPTCATPTTSLTPSPTTPVFDFANTTIVGKCFVCGLDKEEIPRDAYCADAFAGDFLPLNPVDARARGKIARFRKYCRYLDVRHYELNPDEPRAVYGRFTGGCSVRWTDLSGVYTQRTCRNRRRAVLGKHFASKRMAKLEMALSKVDNGCIISPMATLLPLSRGVSLYARFHACVCTGAWCNRVAKHDPWMLNILLPFWFFRSGG